MRRLAHVYRLGLKEIVALRHDPVLLVFLVYGFSLQIVVVARGGGIELKNATVAVVDEDRSPLSDRIRRAFLEPSFLPAGELSAVRETDAALERSRVTFVLVIPPGFQEQLLADRRPELQLNVDATVVGQAYVGAAAIERIVNDEVSRALAGRAPPAPPPAVGMPVRLAFNQNAEVPWFIGVIQLVTFVTMLSILLPGAALLREREQGTLGHLLVMPLTPLEILLAKVWANGLVLLVGASFSLWVILGLVLEVPLRGSLALFLAGTLIFQVAANSVGIFLATLARTTPQLGLLCIMTLLPMLWLSGAFTPLESMHPTLQQVMQISPVTHYVEFTGAVLFRGAGLASVLNELLAMAAIGAVLFTIALARFRRTLGS